MTQFAALTASLLQPTSVSLPDWCWVQHGWRLGVEWCWVLTGAEWCWVLTGAEWCWVLTGAEWCWVLTGVDWCWVLTGAGCGSLGSSDNPVPSLGLPKYNWRSEAPAPSRSHRCLAKPISPAASQRHSRSLARHSRSLARHSRSLPRHSRSLARHSRSLARHSRSLPRLRPLDALSLPRSTGPSTLSFTLSSVTMRELTEPDTCCSIEIIHAGNYHQL